MVKLFLDFDSTITKESTLVRLYMLSELFRDKNKREELERISNEFYSKENEILNRTYAKLFKCLYEENFNKFITKLINIINDYENEIKPYEYSGMKLIEPYLIGLNIEDLTRAKSHIEIRQGFSKFIKRFEKENRYVISCNWSDLFISITCPSIPKENIFSNKFIIKNDVFINFDYNEIILTPMVKFKVFNKYKDDFSVYCGDSLTDILPTIITDISFTFVSHDKNYITLLELIKNKYKRNIIIVKDFHQALEELEKLI